jgi:hypothetical protein
MVCVWGIEKVYTPFLADDGGSRGLVLSLFLFSFSFNESSLTKIRKEKAYFEKEQRP